MKRFQVGLLLAAGVSSAMLMSSAAQAGVRTNFPVSVDTINMVAAGTFGSTRNTGDLVQDLSCRVTVDTSGAWALCAATNAQGTTGTCVTVDPNMLAAINSLGSDSYVQFSWNSIGFCTEVVVINGSETEPKR